MLLRLYIMNIHPAKQSGILISSVVGHLGNDAVCSWEGMWQCDSNSWCFIRPSAKHLNKNMTIKPKYPPPPHLNNLKWQEPSLRKIDLTCTSNVVLVSSTNMEEAGFITFTAASHQWGSRCFRLHFWGEQSYRPLWNKVNVHDRAMVNDFNYQNKARPLLEL